MAILDEKRKIESFESKLKVELGDCKPVDFSKFGKRVNDFRDGMVDTFTYGKKRGLTTFSKEIDKHFTWKPGFLICFTGWPQSGKSELINQLALLRAKFAGSKWLIYTPESGDADEYFDQLIHAYIGKSTDPVYKNQMTTDEYNRGMDFIQKHFIFISDEEIEKQGHTPTPQLLRDTFEFYYNQEKLFGFIKDPWNTLTHDGKMRDDIYLSNELAAEKRLAKKLNICNVILAHPKAFNERYDPKKGLPVPTPRYLAGGQMWWNKCDIIAAVHRPEVHTDPTSPFAEFITQKVKNYRLVGTPGNVEMVFNPNENRYYINGASPLVDVGLQPEFKSFLQINNLTESKFEEPALPF